jgi:hypothetical protein
VCNFYGAEATNKFAIKCIMQNYSWYIIGSGTFICLLLLSYSIRLFERQVQGNFYHITTSMWYVLITMTTVGYGDVFAFSHAGRAIVILTAFIGVIIVSLFVYALYKTMNFDVP